MTKWEALRDSERSDLLAREKLGNRSRARRPSYPLASRPHLRVLGLPKGSFPIRALINPSLPDLLGDVTRCASLGTCL